VKRIISGIQPTHTIHLGNYLGAIKSWLKCFEQGYEGLAFIADLHAITVYQNPKKLRESIFSLTAMYLACGLDTKKCPIFAQSTVREHAELGWILGCFTPGGWLNRMTQYKEKSEKYKESSSLGLYAYPVLQAADILLYKVDAVPVGEDQKQHIELTRDIAEAFHRQTNSQIFKIPEYLNLDISSARVMSLRDGTKKMSKSDESDYSRINLTDSSEIIELKIKKAKSDSIREIYADKENRPDLTNLMKIYSAMTDLTLKEIENNYQGKSVSNFKSDLAEIITSKLLPITKEYHKIIQEKDYINTVLNEGSMRAADIASHTLLEVKKAVGLV
jgi:tryptophanyl-tRNA synthetase